MTVEFDQPQISRYQIETLLGRGGLGRVYRACDGLSGRIVALKLFAEGDQTIAEREFQLLAELDHPGIIKVIGHGLDSEGRPFLAMEYLDGAVDFAGGCRDKPLEKKLDYLRQMLHALAYLHSNDILHRDLKPANVLLVDGQVKLLDFGLAKLLASAGQTLQGTPAYLAPELLRGESPSLASDIYACGVIAYECLTGRHPFDTSSINNLLLGALYEAPEIDSLPLERSIRDFLQALLSADPKQRPSAAQAANQLANMQLKTENEKQE